MQEHREDTKTCCTCKRAFPRSEFYIDRSRKDGLCPSCKTCSKAAKKRSYEKRTAHLRTPEAKIAKALKLLRWIEAQKSK